MGKLHGMVAASSSAVSTCLDARVFFYKIFLRHDEKRDFFGAIHMLYSTFSCNEM